MTNIDNANEHKFAKWTVAKFRDNPDYFELLESVAICKPELLDQMIRLLDEYVKSLEPEIHTSFELRQEYRDALRMQMDCVRATGGVFGPHPYSELVPSKKSSGVEGMVIDVRDTYRGEFDNSLVFGHEIGHGDVFGGKELEYYSETGTYTECLSEAKPELFIFDNVLPNAAITPSGWFSTPIWEQIAQSLPLSPNHPSKEDATNEQSK